MGSWWQVGGVAMLVYGLVSGYTGFYNVEYLYGRR